MSINQRLIDFAEYSKISQQQLREALCVKSRQQVSNWFTHKEKIPDRIVLKIVELYSELNARWFITGEGSMLNSIIEHRQAEDPKANYLTKTDRDRISALEEEVADLKEFIEGIRVYFMAKHRLENTPEDEPEVSKSVKDHVKK